ncbi:helix-turn-helix domain-containing protein [Adlercreutzia sp. ZJ242]|uniref:helix-turn-helix domain-containing protein n=1 Tax=Adlercreutzia sp. ZJ242 TaxID=2709409 RepID=UPI0013EB1F3B|nr:helix-turn-helix transcriptional regulator [Adlercreutzia sp. ZJ242]
MDVDANKAIGMSLQKMRIEAGLTQVELAKRLDKHQSYVSKVEMGERSLHVSELFFYSRALGLTPQEVVSRIERPIAQILAKQKR